LRLLHAAVPAADPYLAKAFAEAGHVVEPVRDVADLLLAAAEGDYDALLIEVAAPSDLPVRRIAAAAGQAVVVLVADRGAPSELAKVLREGADACFVRPVHFMELEARLSALARLGPRAGAAPEALGLDPASRSVRVGGRSLALSMREYALLDYLAGRAGEVVAAEQILEHVWGEAAQSGPERVRTVIARLRGRLRATFGDDPIATVRGHGYRLDRKMKLSSSG
jgi:DNA-binding response OmpR family regulator